MPYPANYGGAIEVFCRIQALHASGVNIHLHCFDYGRGKQPELEPYCASVDYYERFLGHKGISNTLPYIVASRRNELLLQTLLKDDHPILLEGIHCTWPLLDKRFANRKIFVRLHNVEHRYYRQLCTASSSLLKKIYYWLESRLLRSYEKKICDRAQFWAISESDLALFKKMGCSHIDYLPAFVPFTAVQAQSSCGSYCLYQGDLGVEANEQAVQWLLEKVFSAINIPLVITGKDPSASLAKNVAKYSHACLISNPSQKEMQELIEKAQVNLLPSYTSTGIKLKLLNALYNGRHCIANELMLRGSGLEDACNHADTIEEWRTLIPQLFQQTFTQKEIELRKQLLQPFNNMANAGRIINWIWGL